MTLLCNGFPKCGNHALWRAIDLLGQHSGVNHIPYRANANVLWDSAGPLVWNGLPNDTTHHVFIKRDPRNVLVSILRWDEDSVTPGKFLSRFRRLNSASLVTEMATFEGWLTDPATHVVRWEDLIADERALRAIAAYLDVPYLDGAWEELPGYTATFNQVHSDYRTVWTRQVQQAWADEGGDELLARWGY